MQQKKAGFWIRLQAHFIDSLLFMMIYFVPLFLVFSKFPNFRELLAIIGGYLFAVIFISLITSSLYHILLISKFGGSLGKLISGIKVIFEDGNYLTLRQSMFRYFVGNFVSSMLFGAGYFWIFKDKNKQGWHDQISGSFVIYYNRGLRLIGTVLLLTLLLVNSLLISGTIQSIKENKVLHEEINTLIEETEKTLENDQTPATIEPQQPALII